MSMYFSAHCSTICDREIFCSKVPRLRPLFVLTRDYEAEDEYGALMERCYHAKRENRLECHFCHHKLHTDWHKIEPGPPY